jgi:hypothetical protein
MTMRTIITILVALTACDAGFGAELEDEDEADAVGAIDAEVAGDSLAKVVTTGACKNTFDFDKELVIRDLAVVEDPVRATGTGAWTAGHLFARLAGTRDPKALARDWLETWRASPTLDGERVAGNASKVDDILIGPWNADGFALGKAPFRLLAIVLRPEAVDGPELRFVYSAISPAPDRVALPFNVAFEYAVTPAFLTKWHATLKPLARGSAAYLAALELLTEEGIQDTTKLNGSSLRQLRTNEIAVDNPWDLREFHLAATAGGTLARARLAGQPKVKFDGDARLAQGVTPAMETYMAIIPSKDFRWNIPGASEADRFAFAMRTCAGCHALETNTQFVHIKPREAGKKADISAFLQSRICEAGDADCKRLEAAGKFTDPVAPHRFTVQDDRMAALNAVLAAASVCE